MNLTPSARATLTTVSKRGFAPRGEGLVQTFAPQARVFGDLRHTLCSSNIAKRKEQQVWIVGLSRRGEYRASGLACRWPCAGRRSLCCAKRRSAGSRDHSEFSYRRLHPLSAKSSKRGLFGAVYRVLNAVTLICTPCCKNPPCPLSMRPQPLEPFLETCTGLHWTTQP